MVFNEEESATRPHPTSGSPLLFSLDLPLELLVDLFLSGHFVLGLFLEL
jgi:hypothetical protein